MCDVLLGLCFFIFVCVLNILYIFKIFFHCCIVCSCASICLLVVTDTNRA